MLTTNDTIRQKALENKTEEAQLETLAYFALVDLSHFYEQRGSNRQSEVNKLLHRLEELSR